MDIAISTVLPFISSKAHRKLNTKVALAPIMNIHIPIIAIILKASIISLVQESIA